jgi:acid stress-induced BolA-like protein IbaG/YrbA
LYRFFHTIAGLKAAIFPDFGGEPTMQVDELKALLQAKLAGCDVVQVSGDGRHFDLIEVGAVFEGMTPVKKQQHVYAAINDYIADGSLHAVNMKTYTPAQWAALQGK